MKSFNEILDLMARDHYDMTLLITKWKELLAEDPGYVDFRFFDNSIHTVPNFAMMAKYGSFDKYLPLAGGTMDANANIKFHNDYISGGLVVDAASYINPNTMGFCSSSGNSKNITVVSSRGISVTDIRTDAGGKYYQKAVRICGNRLEFHKQDEIFCSGSSSYISKSYDLEIYPHIDTSGAAYLMAQRRWADKTGWDFMGSIKFGDTGSNTFNTPSTPSVPGTGGSLSLTGGTIKGDVTLEEGSLTVVRGNIVYGDKTLDERYVMKVGDMMTENLIMQGASVSIYNSGSLSVTNKSPQNGNDTYDRETSVVSPGQIIVGKHYGNSSYSETVINGPDVTIGGKLVIKGETHLSLQNILEVTGNTQINGTVNIAQNLFARDRIETDGRLHATGALTLGSLISSNNSNFQAPWKIEAGVANNIHYLTISHYFFDEWHELFRFTNDGQIIMRGNNGTQRHITP